MTQHFLTLSQKLREMLFKKNMKPVELARELRMSAPTIHRIVTGKTLMPHKSSLEMIAKYFNVSVDQLTDNDPILPSNRDEIKSVALKQKAKTVPLIQWTDLELMDLASVAMSTLIVFDVSDKSFAVKMPDYSMEPAFQKEAILIFDPEKALTDRNYVLVKLQVANSYVVRQLIIDADQKFIKSLNPDISANSLRLLTKDDKIIARLVEIRSIL